MAIYFIYSSLLKRDTEGRKTHLFFPPSSSSSFSFFIERFYFARALNEMYTYIAHRI